MHFKANNIKAKSQNVNDSAKPVIKGLSFNLTNSGNGVKKTISIVSVFILSIVIFSCNNQLKESGQDEEKVQSRS